MAYVVKQQLGKVTRYALYYTGDRQIPSINLSRAVRFQNFDDAEKMARERYQITGERWFAGSDR